MNSDKRTMEEKLFQMGIELDKFSSHPSFFTHENKVIVTGVAERIFKEFVSSELSSLARALLERKQEWFQEEYGGKIDKSHDIVTVEDIEEVCGEWGIEIGND